MGIPCIWLGIGPVEVFVRIRMFADEIRLRNIFCRVGNREMVKNGNVGKWTKSKFVTFAIRFEVGNDYKRAF